MAEAGGPPRRATKATSKAGGTTPLRQRHLFLCSPCAARDAGHRGTGIQVPSSCTLAVGDEIVLVAHGGPPRVDFALFDAGDIELHSTQPGTIREVGYRTTVGQARARLAEAGFTPALAEQAAAATRPIVARAYARGGGARCIVDRLQASELFESRTFDATTAAYQGTWLELDALASDLGGTRAVTQLRATYLAAALAPIPEDMDVFLSTSELTALRRPGERTFRRVVLESPQTLLDALTAFTSRRARPPETTAGDPGPGRLEIVRWLRERARQAPAAKDRLRELELALDSREPPARGPLADSALWNVEAKLARGETAGVLEQLDAIEQRRGRMPGSIYLRARTSLMTGNEDARAIAERVSALSTSMAAFDELQLLAARAWLAAGDARRARAFARDLLENAAADDVLRMHAREVLEAAGESAAALAPVPTALSDETSRPTPIEPQRVLRLEPPSAGRISLSNVTTPLPPSGMAIPGPPRPPTGTEVAPSHFFPLVAPRINTSPGFATAPHHATDTTPTLTPEASSLPPYRVEPRGERVWSVPPWGEMDLERIAALSLPAGEHSEASADDEPPRSSPSARRVCTLLARELGLALQQRYDVEVRNDVEGLETAQRYLRETLVDGRVRTPEEHREVMRQGGFLSELLARHLGARWVDLESPEADRWAMLIPSRSRSNEVARVWPFARVLRFVAMAHKERDLVSYYLELEGRSR
jgi:hypothetical protein